MSEKPRFIGIDQRVPIEILDRFIANYVISGEMDRNLLKAELASVFRGKNRAKKSSACAWKILTHDKAALQFIRKNISLARYQNLAATDKAAVLLALITNAYPIFNDVIGILAKVYRVQDLVSRKYITQKMSALYGSNRTLAIALGAVFPMLLELGILKREKVGVYRALAGMEISDEKACELFVASGIRLSGGKHISLEDFEYRDWHYFLKPKPPPYKDQTILTVTVAGSRNGYVEYKKIPLGSTEKV